MKTTTEAKAEKAAEKAAAARMKAAEKAKAKAEAVTTEATKAKAEKVLTPVQQEQKDLKERLAAATAKAREEAKAATEARKAEKAVKAEERRVAAEARKAAGPKVKEVKEPDMVSQLDEHGNPELVDRNVFCHEIQCSFPGCTEIRFVTKSGLLEATMCKPHARKTRRQRRLSRVKDAARGYKAAIEEAIKLGLFPKEFMAKHGLSK
jgi:hypothetical protein